MILANVNHVGRRIFIRIIICSIAVKTNSLRRKRKSVWVYPRSWHMACSLPSPRSQRIHSHPNAPVNVTNMPFFIYKGVNADLPSLRTFVLSCLSYNKVVANITQLLIDWSKFSCQKEAACQGGRDSAETRIKRPGRQILASASLV